MKYFLVYSFMFLVFGCSSAQTSPHHLVFIPGAHFNGSTTGSDCFNDLKTELEAKSYSSSTVEFSKSRFSDLTGYAREVCSHLKSQGASFVLGHSQGGAVMTHAFGMCPELFKGMIFVAATIPLPNEKAFDLLSAPDDEYYFQAVQENKQSGFFEITDRQKFLEGFIPDGNLKMQEKVKTQMSHEPIAPSKEVVAYDLGGIKRIKKMAIITSEDRILTAQTQLKYAERLEGIQVEYIESGHLPMVSRPEELGELIINFL